MNLMTSYREIFEAETNLERAKRHKDERKIRGYEAVVAKVSSNFDAMLPQEITAEQRKMIIGTLKTMLNTEYLGEKFMNCADSISKLVPGFSEPYIKEIEDKRKNHEEWLERVAMSKAKEAETLQNTILASDIEEFGQSEAEHIAKWVIGEQAKKRPQEEIDKTLKNHRHKLRLKTAMQESDVEKFGKATAEHIAKWIMTQKEKGTDGTLINKTVEKYRKALTNNRYGKDDCCNALDYDIVNTSIHYRATAQVMNTGERDKFKSFVIHGVDQYKDFMLPYHVNIYLLEPSRDLCALRANISKEKMQRLCSSLTRLAKDYEKAGNSIFASKKEERKQAVLEEMFDTFNECFNDTSITDNAYVDLCFYLYDSAYDDSLDALIGSLNTTINIKAPKISTSGSNYISRSNFLFRYVEHCLNLSYDLGEYIAILLRNKKNPGFTDLPNKHRTYEDYTQAFAKEAEILTDCIEYNYCQSMLLDKERSANCHRLFSDISEYVKETNDTRYDGNSFLLEALKHLFHLSCYCSSQNPPQDYKSLFDALDRVVRKKQDYDRALKAEMHRIASLIEDYNERTNDTISGMGWGGGLVGGLIGGAIARSNYRSDYLIHKSDSEIFRQATENLKKSGITPYFN